MEDYFAIIQDGGDAADVTVDLGNDDAAVIVIDDDIVVRNSGGVDLFRALIASLGPLEISGDDGDNAITLDVSGGSVIPPGGLNLDGGGGNNAIRMIGGASEFDFTAAGDVDAKNITVLDLSDDAPQNVTLDLATILAMTSGRLLAIGGTDPVGSIEDSITLTDADDWRMGDVSIVDGKFIRQVTNVAGGGESFDTDFQQPWRNAVKFGDVNNNGMVTAGDANIIITELGQRLYSDRTTSNLKDPADVAEWPGLYYDHTGDNRATALDALRVINELAVLANQNNSGESEQLLVRPMAAAVAVNKLQAGEASTRVDTFEVLTGDRRQSASSQDTRAAAMDAALVEPIDAQEPREESDASTTLDDVIELLSSGR